MAKNRKVFSPARDADLEALTVRGSSSIQSITSTPINTQSDSADTPPRKLDVPVADVIADKTAPVSKKTTVAKPRSSSTKEKPSPSTDMEQKTHVLAGFIRVDEAIEVELTKLSAQIGVDLEDLVALIRKNSKNMIDDPRSYDAGSISKIAQRNFKTRPSVSVCRFKLTASDAIVATCHKLANDPLKRSPSLAYAAVLSALFLSAYENVKADFS